MAHRIFQQQHAIVSHMMKHERMQDCTNTTLPFMIRVGSMKELADMMQVWTINESTFPAAVTQSPDSTLILHDVDLYIWMKKISLKEDAKVFKQQFLHLFAVSDWFKVLTNDNFHHVNGVNSSMHLNAHKKCPLLRHGVKNETFTQWLRDNAGLTTELVQAIVKPDAAQHVENRWIGTTCNKAARRCHNEWENSLDSRVLFRGTVIANATM